MGEWTSTKHKLQKCKVFIVVVLQEKLDLNFYFVEYIFAIPAHPPFSYSAYNYIL